eukprot:7342026-Pyramimonas_sp.AAC.1
MVGSWMFLVAVLRISSWTWPVGGVCFMYNWGRPARSGVSLDAGFETMPGPELGNVWGSSSRCSATQ